MTSSIFYQNPGGMFWIRKIFPGEFTYVAQPPNPRLTKIHYPLYFLQSIYYYHTPPFLLYFSIFLSSLTNNSQFVYIYIDSVHTLFTHSHPIYGIIRNIRKQFSLTKIFVQVMLLVIFFL